MERSDMERSDMEGSDIERSSGGTTDGYDMRERSYTQRSRPPPR